MKKQPFSKILCCCTGNICRSPMAEYLLRSELPSSSWTVRSAGTVNMHHSPAEPFAIECCRESFDLSSHSSTHLSDSLASWADLILVMEKAQKEYIESHFPFTRGKVFTLLPHQDIPDPYKQSREQFEYSFKLITQGCNEWLERLV